METDATYKNAFKKCCEANGLKVIDVSSNMIDEYKDTYLKSIDATFADDKTKDWLRGLI